MTKAVDLWNSVRATLRIPPSISAVRIPTEDFITLVAEIGTLPRPLFARFATICIEEFGGSAVQSVARMPPMSEVANTDAERVRHMATRTAALPARARASLARGFAGAQAAIDDMLTSS